MNQTGSRISPFITLCGTCEEAMRFYLGVFPGAKQLSLTLFPKDVRGEEGKVMTGELELMGQRILFMDMEEQYYPEQTWAISLFTDCESEQEFDALFAGLSAGGMVMMGPEPVNDLRKVAWVTDKFGVTWQLIWE